MGEHDQKRIAHIIAGFVATVTSLVSLWFLGQTDHPGYVVIGAICLLFWLVWLTTLLGVSIILEGVFGE
jgi:uncharacterized membrane protein